MNEDPSLRAAIQRTSLEFEKRHRTRAGWIVAAPGRVNLIGEHLDYNDGWVLPIAIDRWLLLAAQARPDPIGQFWSLDLGRGAAIPLDQPIRPARDWSGYLRGVLAGYLKRGLSIRGFDAVITSDIPVGGGLSSSAALQVATATLIETMNGLELDPMERARLCLEAEQEFAGVPCGMMDQVTAILSKPAHCLLLDCRSQALEWIPFQDPDCAIMVINTERPHDLKQGDYARRHQECREAAAYLKVDSLRKAGWQNWESLSAGMPAHLHRRARHVLTEIDRTIEAAHAIRGRHWKELGTLMYASHASLRDDFEASTPELDKVVEIARSIGESRGMLGCRMTGAGFGGCAVALIQRQAARAITETLRADYQAATGSALSSFLARPVGGATWIQEASQRPAAPEEKSTE